MKNDLRVIVTNIHDYIHQMFPVLTGENAEMEIIHAVSDELLSELGEIEHKDELRKMLVNMFFAGRMFPENGEEK